jgi:hypothetical protein
MIRAAQGQILRGSRLFSKPLSWRRNPGLAVVDEGGMGGRDFTAAIA